MRWWTYTKRNIIEYLRSPLMLFFTVVFPIVMFLVFQLIKLGTGATDDIVPMFSSANLVPSISIFSFGFLALNASTQIAKDRATQLWTRLRVSPMTAVDFFLGYFIPCIILAAYQTILCFIVGLCFGLKLTLGCAWAIIILIVISTFYISVGILLGVLLSEKACSGVSSIFVNAAALASGMFFPLVDGAFKTALSFLPFLPSVGIPQAFIHGSYGDLPLYCAVLGVYLAASVVACVLTFRRKLNRD